MRGAQAPRHRPGSRTCCRRVRESATCRTSNARSETCRIRGPRSRRRSFRALGARAPPGRSRSASNEPRWRPKNSNVASDCSRFWLRYHRCWGCWARCMGMVDLFMGLQGAGDGNLAIADLASGIWKALLTTAAGLAVAVPALAGHTFLTSRFDKCPTPAPRHGAAAAVCGSGGDSHDFGGRRELTRCSSSTPNAGLHRRSTCRRSSTSPSFW